MSFIFHILYWLGGGGLGIDDVISRGIIDLMTIDDKGGGRGSKNWQILDDVTCERPLTHTSVYSF